MNYDYETLLVEQEDRLLKVTLNKPDRLNAIGGTIHHELIDLFHDLRLDDSIGAVLLTGAGRAFCAGGDVKRMGSIAAGEDEIGTTPYEHAAVPVRPAKRMIENLLAVEVPIIASVRGYAFGIGATIALCCDVVIAAEDALFADTHVTIGVTPGDGGAVIWPLLLPLNTAKYYLMTGERITGRKAEELGLVVKSVPEPELDATAHEIAARIAAGPTLAVKGAKMAVNRIARHRYQMVFEEAALLEGLTMLSEDHREATRAFSEKREPRYTGR